MHLIRNRSLSLLSDSDMKENDKLECTSEQGKGEEKTNDQESAIKICTKLNIRSAEEVWFAAHLYLCFIVQWLVV